MKDIQFLVKNINSLIFNALVFHFCECNLIANIILRHKTEFFSDTIKRRVLRELLLHTVCTETRSTTWQEVILHIKMS